jgi:hypothetical protein
MGQRGKLRTIEGDRLGFWCPGCEEMHVVTVPPHPQPWGFNGNYDAPTFTPSVLVTGKAMPTDDEAARIMAGDTIELKPVCCHSFVTDGRIQFLGDCTHRLAGQTVELPGPPN